MKIHHITNRYELEPFLRGLSDLSERAFGTRISVEFLDWQYARNPVTPTIYMALSIDNGTVVGSYSTSPRTISGPNGPIPASHSMTTMTDPAYQGRGIFPTLAKEVFTRLSNDGRDLVIGFPNVHSHATFVRHLGWTPVQDVLTFTAPLENFRDGCDVESVISSSLPAEGIPITVGDDRFRLLKDAPYLKWRYDENPQHSYSFASYWEHEHVTDYAVFRPYGGDAIDVVEFCVHTPNRAIDLLRAIARTETARPRSSVNLWLTPGHHLRGDLERQGFQPRLPVHHFGYRMSGENLVETLRAAYRWDLQMGDSDVF